MSYCFEKTDGHFCVEPQHAGLVASKLKQHDYDWELDENGGINDAWPKGQTLGEEFEMFKEIAPYIESESFFEFRGEDGTMWRWIFSGGECREITATLTWPEGPPGPLPELKDGDAIFSAAQSRPNHCPTCGAELEYGSFEVKDDSIEYPWTCKSCGHEGYEYGNIVFDGHKVLSYFPSSDRQEDGHV